VVFAAIMAMVVWGIDQIVSLVMGLVF
jgi:preprotein translocase subunit SecE